MVCCGGEMYYLSEGQTVHLNISMSSFIHLLGAKAEPSNSVHIHASAYVTPLNFPFFPTSPRQQR